MSHRSRGDLALFRFYCVAETVGRRESCGSRLPSATTTVVHNRATRATQRTRCPCLSHNALRAGVCVFSHFRVLHQLFTGGGASDAHHATSKSCPRDHLVGRFASLTELFRSSHPAASGAVHWKPRIPLSVHPPAIAIVCVCACYFAGCACTLRAALPDEC